MLTGRENSTDLKVISNINQSIRHRTTSLKGPYCFVFSDLFLSFRLQPLLISVSTTNCQNRVGRRVDSGSLSGTTVVCELTTCRIRTGLKDASVSSIIPVTFRKGINTPENKNSQNVINPVVG